MLTAALLIAAAVLLGCTKTRPVSPPSGGDPPGAIEPTGTVTAADLDEARAVLMRYFEALGQGDTAMLLDTVTDDYKRAFTQGDWPEQSKTWVGVRLLKVGTTGTHVTPDEWRSAYFGSGGRIPFQVAVFRVSFDQPHKKYPEQLEEMDVLVVRESRGSRWLIDNMGN